MHCSFIHSCTCHFCQIYGTPWGTWKHQQFCIIRGACHSFNQRGLWPTAHQGFLSPAAGWALPLVCALLACLRCSHETSCVFFQPCLAEGCWNVVFWTWRREGKVKKNRERPKRIHTVTMMAAQVQRPWWRLHDRLTKTWLYCDISTPNIWICLYVYKPGLAWTNLVFLATQDKVSLIKWPVIVFAVLMSWKLHLSPL